MKVKDLIIFDIDRTIYDGSIGQDFIIELVNEGLISSKILVNLSLELLEYELNIETYQDTVKKALTALSQELNNKNLNEVRDIAQKVIQYNHYKFYDYAFELPKVFKEFDYCLLSLEPQILVSEIASYLKIPNFICNEFPIKNNLIHKPHEIIINKSKLLENSEFKNRRVICAFGDSENDYDILKQADLKMMVNPTPRLLEKSGNQKNFHQINPKIAYDEFKKNIINFA